MGLAARVGVGLVWVVAGALKLPDPAAAERAVRASRLLPEALVGPMAFGLPALEIVVGLALVLGVADRWAAVASALLLVVFIVAVSSAWARGLQIDCGSGGGGAVGADQTAYLSEVVRNLGLLAVSAALVRRPRSRWALGAWITGDPAPDIDGDIDGADAAPSPDLTEEGTHARRH